MADIRVPSRAQWLRRLATLRRDRVGLVLSGGGPLGALQVGALRALFEHGVRPDLVTGTSVGALNAAFVAIDPSPEGIARLESVWLSMEDQDLFPGGRLRRSWARFLTKGDCAFENDGLQRLIDSRLPGATFENAEIPLGVVATELDTGREHLFTSGPLREPLLASSAMPGVFPPIEIDGRRYIDGGVSNSVPVAPAISMGARTLYVVNSTAQETQKRPLTRPLDYLLHAFTLARAQRVALEQAIYADKVKIVMLPSIHLDFYVPFATLVHTERLIALAYEQTGAFLSGRVAPAVVQPRGGDVEVIAPAK